MISPDGPEGKSNLPTAMGWLAYRFSWRSDDVKRATS